MPPNDELPARAASLSSATLHEAAGRIGALPSFIKPLSCSMRLFARALPVRCMPGDNLWLHRALVEARAGEALVVDTGGGIEYGYWGEVMTVAARERGVAGLVIAGGVRDSLRIIETGFPVFSAGICIRGAGKDPGGPGAIAEPIVIGRTAINRGDLICADADGVMVLPAGRAAAAIEQGYARELEEQRIFARLRNGETTMAIYSLPMHERPDVSSAGTLA